MNGFRTLSATEHEYLLNLKKNDPSRKILHVFFGLWKAMFFLSVFGVVSSCVEAIQTGNYFQLFIILGLGITYLWFWVLPNFILKKIDREYTALKTRNVWLRETPLVSCRMHRERSSSSSHNYHNVYYATVWHESGAHTYEIQTSQHVATMIPSGELVYVLRYVHNASNSPDSITEFVLPLNFMTLDEQYHDFT